MNKGTIRECNNCEYRTMILKDDVKSDRICKHCKGSLEVIAIEGASNSEEEGK